jgi:hypothetical protein
MSPNQMIHDPVSHDTINAICTVYELLLPRPVILSSTIDASATLAQVILSADDKLTANSRRFAMDHQVVRCHVLGGGQPAPTPNDFNPRALQWVIQSATHIALSRAGYPKSKKDVAGWGMRAVENGARFISIIEYPVEKFSEWLDVIRRSKRVEIPLQLFGLENVAVAV